MFHALLLLEFPITSRGSLDRKEFYKPTRGFHLEKIQAINNTWNLSTLSPHI